MTALLTTRQRVVLGLILAILAFALMASATKAARPEFVTFCHGAGLAGTTQFVTLTLPYQAVFGQAGHFNEDGTPAAGHEQDYLGVCVVETPAPTPSPQPTETPAPTASPEPTATPSATATPSPVETPAPSVEPLPDTSLSSIGSSEALMIAFLVILAVSALLVLDTVIRKVRG